MWTDDDVKNLTAMRAGCVAYSAYMSALALSDPLAEIVRLREALAEAEATNANNLGLLEIIEQVGVERDRLASKLVDLRAKYDALKVSTLDEIRKAREALAEAIQHRDTARNDCQAWRKLWETDLAAEREAHARTRSDRDTCLKTIADLLVTKGGLRENLNAEREAHARTKAELAAVGLRASTLLSHLTDTKDAHAETSAKLQHMEDTLCLSSNQLVHEDGSSTREIYPERVGDVMARSDRAEGILRELRAWLRIEASDGLLESDPLGWYSRDVLAKLDNLEATHADDRR